MQTNTNTNTNTGRTINYGRVTLIPVSIFVIWGVCALSRATSDQLWGAILIIDFISLLSFCMWFILTPNNKQQELVHSYRFKAVKVICIWGYIAFMLHILLPVL